MRQSRKLYSKLLIPRTQNRLKNLLPSKQSREIRKLSLNHIWKQCRSRMVTWSNEHSNSAAMMKKLTKKVMKRKVES